MVFDIQSIRDITTGVLHTSMQNIEKTLCSLTGVDNLSTVGLIVAREKVLPH